MIIKDDIVLNEAVYVVQDIETGKRISQYYTRRYNADQYLKQFRHSEYTKYYRVIEYWLIGGRILENKNTEVEQ